MKLFIYFITVLAMGKGRIISVGSCSNDFSEVVEFPDDRDDCVDGTCSLYAEKRMIGVMPEKIVERRHLMPRMQTVSASDSFNQWSPVCGCVTQHKLINLGEGHYPRYITMAKCKAKTCANKFFQCKYYYYRVHVLVKRGLSSILKNDEELDVRDVEELTIPESLHANWQLFALSIPVACIAVERS